MYGERAKLCYTDTDSFVIHIKTENVFEDISNDVERWFDTSNCDENDKILPPIGKNKKIPALFKDELEGKIMVEVVALRPKTWAYLMDDGSDKKKAKGTNEYVIKHELMKIIKIACLMKKQNLNSNKDLKTIIMMCSQIKLIRLR